MENIELKTGTLSLDLNNRLKELIGFTSRANNKRGFLFVSKVLGKHIPCKPSDMEKVHKELADILKPQLNKKPTIVIGFAETATGIGNGVYSQLNMENSFYIHTTRYKLSAPTLLEFQEEHCHAPSHILYDVNDEKLKKIIQDAENIVLVDDEITTGKTLVNIINKLREKFPHIKNYFAVSILNWAQQLPDNINFINLYTGNFSFEEKTFAHRNDIISITTNNNNLDEFIPFNFGRFGIKDLQLNFKNYININNLKNKKVLILGTGEFMHQAFLLGKYLENKDIDVYVQSATRSPINLDCDIVSKLEFKDNYYENIDNFVYNVIDKTYDKVLICYETVSLPQNHNLKSLLEKYFPDVEELFLQTRVEEKIMFHGSYLEDDVTFLLKPIEIMETALLEKEKLIQSGKKHYSEMISVEYAPSKEYLNVFYKALEMNKEKMAKNILVLANFFSKRKDIILVSLARAGTPIGVLLKRTLRDIFDINVPHYSISIIRDRGIDKNALKHILQENGNNDQSIVFIDGWTGKGVISRELKDSISNFNKENNTNISSDLFVLSDISGKAEVSVTSEDYLIPSAVLNSTISGLISRSILNDSIIGSKDFHGCKYYKELTNSDLSLWFIDTMMESIKKIPKEMESDKIILDINPVIQQTSEAFIKHAMEKYNVRNINYVKPGIGETTRVLLRRIPDKILVKDLNLPEIEHLLVLAKEKEVLIEEIKDMPYKAVGIISDLER